MYTITRGYKQGRGVVYYDLSSPTGELIATKVDKAKIVEYCSNGEISNAKVQWWEGKAIVRLSDKNTPLVKLDNDGNVIESIQKSIRTSAKSSDNKATSSNSDAVPKSEIVGKLDPKKAAKRVSKYDGYSNKNLEEQINTRANVDFSVFSTVGDMVDALMEEFKIRDKDRYREEINKKVNIDKDLKSMNVMAINAMASSLATYLMNMAMEELNNTYLKYFVR